MTRVSMKNIVEDLTKLSPEKKEEFAEKFCEGNEDLKKLLLKMWNNGIQTYASCAGHDLSEMQTTATRLTPTADSYIYFDVRNLSEKQQNKLFKNLIMISKNLHLIKNFDLSVDNVMGFERHALRIIMQNSEHSYKVLNDLFDDILKKESVFETFKRFLIKKNKDDGLTINEADFVKSLVDLNKISFIEYLSGASDLENDEKFECVKLEYRGKKGMSLTARDCVKTGIGIIENDIGNYWCQVAEGMYTKDPHQENVFYTMKNGEVIKLKENEINGLKEFIDERNLNFSIDYSAENFEKLQQELEEVITKGKGKDV